MIEAHQLTTSEGLRIYYQVYGPEQGPPVILLHGLASNLRIWGSQIAALKSHYRVYVFDYPGHGRSEQRPCYTIENLTDVLSELINHLNLPKVHLVGLSLGCAVALGYAASHPDRVASLVLEGPFGGIYHRFHLKSLGLMMMVIVYLSTLWMSFKLFGQKKTVYWLNKYGIQTHGLHQLLVSVQCQVDPKAVRHLTWGLIQPPYIKTLRQLNQTIPAVIIVGEDDRTPPTFYQFVQKYLNCPIVKLENCRHVAHVDNSGAFNETMLRFLHQVTADASLNDAEDDDDDGRRGGDDSNSHSSGASVPSADWG